MRRKKNKFVQALEAFTADAKEAERVAESARQVDESGQGLLAQRLEDWERERDALSFALQLAQESGEPWWHDSGAFVLKPAEIPYLVGSGAGLVELRRAPGHYEGGTAGVSIHVTKGVTARLGGIRGRYVPGPETPTPIDRGEVLISNQRVAFVGDKQTREWLFSKLVAVSHDESGVWTALQVSNRQKTSGVLYDADAADTFRLRLEVAIAAFRHELPELIGELRSELQAHDMKRPDEDPRYGWPEG